MCPMASNWQGMSVQGHPRVQAKWDTHAEKGRRRTGGIGGGLFCDMSGMVDQRGNSPKHKRNGTTAVQRRACDVWFCGSCWNSGQVEFVLKYNRDKRKEDRVNILNVVIKRRFALCPSA